jgi:hypothetical protein
MDRHTRIYAGRAGGAEASESYRESAGRVASSPGKRIAGGAQYPVPAEKAIRREYL